MRWAIFGDKGMLGTELTDLLQANGQNVVGFNRSNFDIALTPSDIARELDRIDVLVNCIAFTNVDLAESSADEALYVNGHFAGSLANAAASSQSRLVHISTDYVFGNVAKTPIRLGDETNPLNVYGKSKLLGEQLVLESGADASVFRTSWLYGKHGECFPRKIAKRLLDDKAVRVVDDQLGAPTWTRDLSQLIFDHVSTGLREPLVHAVASNSTSWFDFACEVARDLPGQDYSVSAISSEEISTAALRPKYSVLDNSESSGPRIGDWLDRWRVASSGILGDLFGEQVQ